MPRSLARYPWHWLVAAVLLLAFANRVCFLQLTPQDWDESVYTNVTRSVATFGFPALTNTQGLEAPEPYGYHPWVYFTLLAGWFEILGRNDIFAARLLNAFIGVIAVALVMRLTLITTKQRYLVIIVGALAATDGWFTYSTSLVKFDVLALVFGLAGLCEVTLGLRRGRHHLALGGFLIGYAVATKYIAAIFVIAVVLNWVVTRRHHVGHVLVLCAAAAVAAIQTGLQFQVAEAAFARAIEVQIKRTLGLQASRGLNYGLSEVIEALTNTYLFFSGSLLVVALAGVTAVRTLRLHWRGQDLRWSLVTMSVLAALITLAAIRLRNPHYLVLILGPAFVMVGIWLDRGFHGTHVQRCVAHATLAIILLVNCGSLWVRLTQFSQFNALEQVREFLAQSSLSSVVVLSEEPVCAMIAQECYRFGSYQSQASIDRIQPDLIVVYSSLTQRPPQSEAILSLLSQAREVVTFAGWREQITVFEVPP